MPARPAAVRINDFYEVYEAADPVAAAAEGERCMNCGAAFCVPDSGYGEGCPIHNHIPEWNELVRLGRWRDAYDRLSLTNPFPEFTSRICPAPCQDACIHGINDSPVQIKGIERAIIDRAFHDGWVQPPHGTNPTARSIAIIGSGPAGLAAADALIRRGHDVTVYERSDRPGGLLTYGVPNMKLDKLVVARRIALLERGGVRFETGRDLGGRDDPRQVLADHDATLLAVGALRPRGLDLPGRDLAGVHEAMEYLEGSTRWLLDAAKLDGQLDAADRDVVVIGGGDTGADCLGTALRQGCRSLVNITRRERAPDGRAEGYPWPGPTGGYTLDYAHAEGVARDGRDPRAFEVEPLAFLPDERHAGRVGAVRVRRLDGGLIQDVPASLVILAIGFTGHDASPLADTLGLTTGRGRLGGAEHHRTERPGVYVAGDCRRGPSLVVWAIREGRDAAAAIDADLSR